MYADKVTKSMQLTIDETNYRRTKQTAYNKAHNLTPKALNKSLDNVLTKYSVSSYHFEKKEKLAQEKEVEYLSSKELEKRIKDRRKLMERAAMDLDFIAAAALRDEIKLLQEQKKKL
jgi:excinuclease ABC subunit B